jgi:serine/threonine protein phosphatase 1
MRVLAIGDIHGCVTAYDVLLTLVQPKPSDLVVTLGDYIDRGPDSKGILNRLLRLSRSCRHIAIAGNHDLMMLNARNGPTEFEEWYGCGAKNTLRSYGADPNWDTFAASVPDEHFRFIGDRCVSYYEIDTHFFVHANAYPDYPLDEQPDYMLHWQSLDPEMTRPHESGKTMICGHTSQKTGVPLVLDHAICIDTWVYGDTGWLTCLDVKSGKYWQANERGETQLGWIDELR